MNPKKPSRVLVLAMTVAALVTVAVLAGGSGAAAAPAPGHQALRRTEPSLQGAGDPGAYADEIASKIADPSFTRLIFDLIKEPQTGPGIEDVLRELAEINKKLDVLDRKLDDIAADVAEIRTNQYWIELQKYTSAISYVQEDLADIGKEKDAEDRQARSRALARFVQDNLTPYRKTFQNFVLTAPGGRKGIIPALSDQQKLSVRFWGPKETENLIQAYDCYSAFQALLAGEVAQAKVAVATSASQREKAEADAKDIGQEAKETIAKQVAELPKGMPGTTAWQIDVQSRLLWYTKQGAAPLDWSKAVAEVQQSRVGGFGNWRMPSNDDYDLLGPGCSHRNYRDPCAFAAVVAKRGWKLPTTCGGRNVWWSSTPQLSTPAGFIWDEVKPMQGQVAHSPGTACVFQVREVGSGERYWM
ncbi:MAG TPA: hypothetical protein VH299_04800 [Solirubrobacterales bacterium]|nr:hypothetical protein [Solirubrobacterales bacterium]